MTFTGITKDNYKAFQPLLSNLRFDDNRIFTGVIQDDRPVGAAVFSAAEDVLCLVWIYVPKEYRRQGIGKALLAASLEEIRKRKPVPLYVSFPECCTDLLAFFDKQDFRRIRDGRCFSAPLSTWLDSPMLKALIEKTELGESVSLSELTFSEWEALEDCIRKEGLDPMLVHTPEISRQLSFVEIDPETGVVEACILTEEQEDTFSILLAANFSHQAEDLLATLSSLYDSLRDREMEDRQLVFLTMDEGMQRLAEKLAGDPSSIRSLGPMICCTDMPSREKPVSRISCTLSEAFREDTRETAFSDSWLLDIVYPEDFAPESEEDRTKKLFFAQTLAKSQSMKRGLKFLKKAKLQDTFFTVLSELSEKTEEASLPADLSVFEYQSDNEFIEKFSANYPALQRLKEERPDDPMICEIVSDYENQIELIGSPFYPLFAGKNVARLTDKHIQSMRKNLEKDRQLVGFSVRVERVLSFLDHLEASRENNSFRKGKKIRKEK